MKIKTAYIYGAVAILVTLFLILFTPSETKKGDLPNNGLSKAPNDETHKGLETPGSPSGSNVSPSVTERMAALKEAADKTPPDTAAIKDYADFSAMAHKPDEAVKYYEKILKIDHKRTDVRFELAYIFYMRGDYSKAEKLTEEVLAYDPGNVQAKYNIGAAAIGRGDKDKAVRIWSELLKQKIDPELKNKIENSLNSLK